MMQYINNKFRYVINGDIIKCKPGSVNSTDRKWTDCRVLKKRSTTLGGGYERLELFVKILSRKNHRTWIFSEDDTDL